MTMIREEVQCAGPCDVRQEFRKRVALPKRAVIVENQKEYRREQMVIAAFYAGTGEQKLATMPPCTCCPVDVFHYCETTGTECRQFRIYASGGRDE